MSNVDPEFERRRLAQTYAQFTDAELEQVVRSSGDLTEVAQVVLRSEMDRRGLGLAPGLEVHEEPAEHVFEPLVTIRQFRDLPEALLAKGSLESAGIECGLWDENLVRLDWFWSNLIGGIRLKVAQSDAETADAILSQPIPEDLEVPGVGDYHQPRCPKCQSLDVTYRELNQPVAYISACFRMPIPLERWAWRCHGCDAEWEDSDTLSESESKPDLQ